jgi:cytoskeletal protein RodZ
MKWRKGDPSAPEPERPKGFDDYDLRLGDLMRGERATLGKSLLDVQRELKIKATYIAAIENADLSAFETQGFVAGYVRSYARFLGMDPEWAYAKFCAETDYEAPALAATPAAFTQRGPARQPARARPRPVDPLANPNAPFVPRRERWTEKVEPGALTSILVLAALIGGIGYGGWSVLREVQRVQVAPISQAPNVIAEIDPLGNVGSGTALRVAEPESAVEPAGADAAPSLEAMGRLYRPERLDTPLLVPRDGPIAAIDPRDTGAYADVVAAAEPEALSAEAPVQVTRPTPPPVEIFAVRPTWVRVQAADGTVLFEKILDPGERYTVPQGEAPARLRAGNSGSLYFAVNGETYGPAAPGAQVVRNIALSPEALKERYTLADLTSDPDLARIVAMAEAEQPAE